MTNNFKQIREILDFSIPDSFYYLQVQRRKKENPDAKHNKIIKNFYIDSFENYDSLQKEIISMCEYFNARAYLRLNRRSWKMVFDEMLEYYAKYNKYEQYRQGKNLFSKACGNTNIESPRIWIVDVDDENELLVKSLIEKLQQDIKEDYRVIKLLETKNGHHIITHPFNVKSFKYTFPNVDIHKDNPTLLYCP